MEVLIFDIENYELFEGDFSADGDTLTVSFEYNSTEEFLSAYALTSEITADLNEYSDEATGEFDTGDGDTGDVDTGDGDTGDQDTGGSGIFDSSAILIFIAVIAVICIVGVAVIIYIIRR